MQCERGKRKRPTCKIPTEICTVKKYFGDLDIDGKRILKFTLKE
jgi:hypothetical protein